jgi:hypothetical protein
MGNMFHPGNDFGGAAHTGQIAGSREPASPAIRFDGIAATNRLAPARKPYDLT